MTNPATVIDLGPRLLARDLGRFEPRDYPPLENPARVFVRKYTKSPNSADAMNRCLGRVAELVTGGAILADRFPWAELRYSDLEAIKAELAEVYTPAGVNLNLSAVRGVLRTCFALGYLDREELERCLMVEGIRQRGLLSGRALAAGELRKLFGTLGRSELPGARRDALVFALLYACGVRRSELVGVDLADLDLERRELKVRIAKGRRARVVPLPTPVDPLLFEWLEIRGDEPGPLFCRMDRWRRVYPGERISASAILTVCRKWCRHAGLAAFSPHDLRRSYTSDLLAQGVDVLTVAELLGHASVSTTRRYDRRGAAVRHVAVERLTLPF